MKTLVWEITRNKPAWVEEEVQQVAGQRRYALGVAWKIGVNNYYQQHMLLSACRPWNSSLLAVER